MIRKVLEAIFRHKLLLILPPILIPGIVTPIAVATTPSTYDSSVGIWVDRPTLLTVPAGDAGWTTPVQNASSRLGDLLHTRAFVDDVARRTTTLARLVGTPSGEAELNDLVSKSVTIGGAGATSDHLLLIHVTSTSPTIAYELCKAIVDAYQEKTAADQADQSDVAVQFYQQQVKDTQTQLTKATGDLRRYVSAQQGNVQDTTTDPTSPLNLPANMLDAKLQGYSTAVQSAQANYNAAQNALRQAQQDSIAMTQGQELGFQVLDPPQMAPAATRPIKKIIVYPIAGAVAGLGLAAMLLVLLVAADRSVHTEADLSPPLRMLGTVPMLKVKRVPKKLRGVATRRAIGAAAGTALPAPGGVH